MNERLTIDLHNRLAYDPATGEFTWLVSAGRVKAGTRAGVLKPHGYTVIQVNGTAYGAHRLAWLYVYGVMPADEIDHINGNRSDNRIENLRDVPRSTNQQNQRRPQAHNKTSSYIGVSWHSGSQKWRASITVGGRTRELGRFCDEQQARDCYVAAKRVLHEGCTL